MKQGLLILGFLFGYAYSVCDHQYEYAGTECKSGPQPGATRLAEYLRQTYGGSIEIFNCRSIPGSTRKSLHAEGRAVDHYVNGTTGSNVFRAMQTRPGVQEVIFNGQIWTSSRGVQQYNGSSMHIDNVHIGLNWCGAR